MNCRDTPRGKPTCEHRECAICGGGHGEERYQPGMDGLCYACREFWRDRDVRAVFLANCEAVYCATGTGGKRGAAEAIQHIWLGMRPELKYFNAKMRDLDLPKLIAHLMRSRCTPACKYTALPLSPDALAAIGRRVTP